MIGPIILSHFASYIFYSYLVICSIAGLHYLLIPKHRKVILNSIAYINRQARIASTVLVIGLILYIVGTYIKLRNFSSEELHSDFFIELFINFQTSFLFLLLIPQLSRIRKYRVSVYFMLINIIVVSLFYFVIYFQYSISLLTFFRQYDNIFVVSSIILVISMLLYIAILEVAYRFVRKEENSALPGDSEGLKP